MLRISTLTLTIGGVLLLSGCASSGGLTTRGQPLDVANLHSEQSLADAPLSAAAWPNAHWWAAFGDPQLDALIDEAFANAPSVAAADARAQKAQAVAGMRDAARKPVVGASAQAVGMQLPQSLAGDDIGGDFKVANVLMLSLKYSPDLWGKDKAQWQAAVDSAHAAEVDAQAARLTLAANIARTYVALAHAFDAQDVATAEAKRNQTLAELHALRQQAGLDNTIAVNAQRSAQATAQQQALAAQQHIDSLRNALAALLGAGPDRGLTITRPTLAQPTLAIPASLPSGLLARRADIVAARWRVEAAQHGIDASNAAFYPSINLSALAGLAASNLGDLFSSDALLFNGGPALSLPIFEGGHLRNQLRASNADYDLAVAAYNQTVLNAIREATDALQAVRVLDARIASVSQARDAASQAHTLMQQRYQAGLSNRLNVLTTQQPLLQLQQQLAALNAQRRIVSIDLDQALGGGLTVHAPTSTASK